MGESVMEVDRRKSFSYFRKLGKKEWTNLRRGDNGLNHQMNCDRATTRAGAHKESDLLERSSAIYIAVRLERSCNGNLR